jgi:hypothetical protein
MVAAIQNNSSCINSDSEQQLLTTYRAVGIRQNLFEIYYFEKLHAPHARAALARALAPRATVGGMSQL